MGQAMRNTQDRAKDISVVDVLLYDHQFLKDCIEVLISDKQDKARKLFVSKRFLNSLQKHSAAERRVVYDRLEPNEELHFNILEARVEHDIIDDHVKKLKSSVARTRTLRDELEMELKVLALHLKGHLQEEESELLPKIQEEVDEDSLFEMGSEFMKLRKLESKDLEEFPILQDELMQWKDSVQRLSSLVLSRPDANVDNLKH